MNQLNQLIVYVSKAAPFRSGLDRHLIRAAMVFTFFAFSIQKWSQYTAEMLVPLIRHSPVVFWLLPAFGVRGAGFFLGTTETIFGSLIFLGYWSPKLGILGALGSIATFIGTTSIIPFLPDGWANEAGGFPIMTLPLGFLMKDVLFLVASFYLLKQDLTRAAEKHAVESPDQEKGPYSRSISRIVGPMSRESISRVLPAADARSRIERASRESGLPE